MRREAGRIHIVLVAVNHITQLMDLNVYCIDKCYVTTIKDYLDQIFVLSQIGPSEDYYPKKYRYH